MSTLVTKPAPDFTANAVLADNTIDEEFTLSSMRGKYVILFFYPLDFTFVCPTEILAFDEALDEFSKRTPRSSGFRWTPSTPTSPGRRPRSTTAASAPSATRSWPTSRKRSPASYGVLFDDEVALRGLFLIDREGIIRHAVINDLPLGRNVSEAIGCSTRFGFTRRRAMSAPRTGTRATRGWTPPRMAWSTTFRNSPG